MLKFSFGKSILLRNVVFRFERSNAMYRLPHPNTRMNEKQYEVLTEEELKNVKKLHIILFKKRNHELEEIPMVE